MYLVEFIKIFKNVEKKFCLGFYSRSDAMKYSSKLIHNSSVKSVSISQTDPSFTQKIYDLKSF